MSSSVLGRGSQPGQRMRRRQGPLSGRQSAVVGEVTLRQERPGDTIALARKLAEEKP